MLQVCVLGEQSITDERTAIVRIRSSRTVALLGFLAAHPGSPQARQRIAGLFWPESADGQALTNLRRELHNLRQVMGDEQSLVVSPRDLCWRDSPTCRVDLRVFDSERKAAQGAAGAGDIASVLAHGDAALASYRGEFLPGSYEDWLLDIRSELQRQCADLCDLMAETRAGEGDVAGAAAAARRRIQLQPLEEVGYRTLMRLQADLGDRAGALSTYHHCASVLERELGVVPDQATQELLARLMKPGEAVLKVPAPKALASPSRPGAASAQLIGRSRELGLLSESWQTAAAGRAGLVVVRGGAGVGKTRLVAEVADLARANGAVIASTQCFAARGRLPLAPVADWLRNPAVRPGIDRLEDAWRIEVHRLVPTDHGDSADVAGARATVDAWQRHRFFEGLARALIGPGRPTLLILDNLHWCDEETLAFLAFSLALDPAAPLLVMATLRDDRSEGDDAPADWVASMRASGLLAEITLAPMEEADTARLAERISGRTLREPDVQLLHATTGGFPLFIVEAMRGSQDPGLGSVPVGDLSAVLLNRLGQVSPAAREIAGLAAAVGTDFTLGLLTEASDLSADLVVGAVDELWRRRIVQEFRDGYDFSHDLLRDAAYGQVSPPRRWLLHRRIAQGLELLYADGTDQVAAQLAEQYARGGQPQRAVAYYARAAELATRVFAHAEAIRLHNQALSVVQGLSAGAERDGRELMILEAVAAPLNARYGYASLELERTLQRSIELAQSLGRREALLTGLVALNTCQFVQGRTAKAKETAARALALAEPGSQLKGHAHFCFGGTSLSLGRPAEAIQHLDLAVQQAAGSMWLTVGTRPDVHGPAWKAHAHWLLGNVEAALEVCGDAITAGRAVGDPYSMAVALAYAGITYQFCGRLSEMGETVAELRELCERHDFAYYREWGLIQAGWLAGGDPGISLVRQGIGNLRAAGAFARMPYWLSLLGDLIARQGRRDAARATLDGALVTGRAHDDVWWLPEVLRMRAAYDDDEQAALARLRAAAAMAAAHGSIALLRRCEADIEARGVRQSTAGVRHGASGVRRNA
ncbi:MAG TPA: AAA family ATPase [Streptosporangiaceae bacterium]|nr:AAA family ATPase [Streptosporangiaceae bacterium]